MNHSARKNYPLNKMSASIVAMSGRKNQERAYIFSGWSKTEVLLLEASLKNILILKECFETEFNLDNFSYENKSNNGILTGISIL